MTNYIFLAVWLVVVFLVSFTLTRLLLRRQKRRESSPSSISEIQWDNLHLMDFAGNVAIKLDNRQTYKIDGNKVYRLKNGNWIPVYQNKDGVWEEVVQ